MLCGDRRLTKQILNQISRAVHACEYSCTPYLVHGDASAESLQLGNGNLMGSMPGRKVQHCTLTDSLLLSAIEQPDALYCGTTTSSRPRFAHIQRLCIMQERRLRAQGQHHKRNRLSFSRFRRLGLLFAVCAR
jgi:hypothetical protein